MILSRKRSDRRDRRICRFGVMLVVCSLLVNMVCVPKAKAVVIDATAAFGAAAATAAINGTTATTLFTGMTTSAATSAMTGLMGEYAVATGAASSGTALAASIGAGTVITAAGAIVLTAAAAFAVYKFIDWLREEKGLEAGGESVNIGTPTGMIVYNGVQLPDIESVWTDKETYPYAYLGTGTNGTLYLHICSGNWYMDSSSNQLFASGAHSYQWYRYDSAANAFVFYQGYEYTFSSFYCIVPFWASVDLYYYRSATNEIFLSASDPVAELVDDAVLKPLQTLQTIPQEITDGQAMVITGIENLPQADPQAAADLIMQTVIDGNLSPTVTVEADPTATPEPEPEPSPDPDPEPEPEPSPDPDPEPEPEPSPDPDAPELPSNLGDLGAALTTRFPFSIPWDIARAIKLIAAPAQAPYWEVDFLAPMAHWVGGFSGSTKVVLDFGKPEYEIIGIASRWTSTIGFCLALAAATKRFIWTA